MDGVIYVATRPDYVDLAVQSARSLRLTNPGVPVDLFCDGEPVPNGLFDRVHAVPKAHSRAKLDCLSLSRFERTLFLDADTLVVGDLGDIWGLLDRFDLAMAHDVRRASDLIQQGLDARTPYAFPQLNSGVVLYKKSQTTDAFFNEWALKFHASNVPRDQIILKDLLWNSNLQFYVLPPEFNLRRVTEIDAWEPLDAEIKIVHSHRLQQHLHGAGQRVSSLEEIVRLEREALVAEWKSAGIGDLQLLDKINWFVEKVRVSKRQI